MADQNSEIAENPVALNAYQPFTNEVVLNKKIDEWLRKQFQLSDLPELISAIHSNDRFKQHYGAIGLRKLLTMQDPPIQRIIDENLIPKLIEFVQNDNEYYLQLESVWTLTNIASGTIEQIQVIVDNGGLPIFVKLLKSPHLYIAEQAIWAIGNIAGDSVSLRDMVLNLGALEPLLQIANKIKEQDIRKNCVWAISNLCKGKPLPSFDMVKSAIPTLYRIFQTEADPEMLSDSAWALAFLSEKERRIDYGLAKGVISASLGHINGPNHAIIVPSLSILGNLTFDDAVQSIALKNTQYLSTLFTMACNHNVTIRSTSCWVISNITAGDAKQIETVIDNPIYVDILIKISTSDVLKVQTEALYALTNALTNSTRNKNMSTKQLAEFIDLGVLDCFLYLLDSGEPKIVKLAARGVSEILSKGVQMDQVGRVMNEFREIFITKKGVEKIKDLGNHPNGEVKSMALKIFETHFEIRI